MSKERAILDTTTKSFDQRTGCLNLRATRQAKANIVFYDDGRITGDAIGLKWLYNAYMAAKNGVWAIGLVGPTMYYRITRDALPRDIGNEAEADGLTVAFDSVEEYHGPREIELSNGGYLSLDEDGTVRYRDQHGNTEGVWDRGSDECENYCRDYFPEYRIPWPDMPFGQYRILP